MDFEPPLEPKALCRNSAVSSLTGYRKNAIIDLHRLSRTGAKIDTF